MVMMKTVIGAKPKRDEIPWLKVFLWGHWMKTTSEPNANTISILIWLLSIP